MFRNLNAVEDKWLNQPTKDDKIDVNNLCVIDQFAGADFNLNDCGWIRNDLANLARAQSQAEYNMIMQRLVEIKQQGGIPDNVSLEDAVKNIKPRWAQSPNELELFLQMTNEDAFKRLNDAYEKAVPPVPDAKVEAPVDSSVNE